MARISAWFLRVKAALVVARSASAWSDATACAMDRIAERTPSMDHRDGRCRCNRSAAPGNSVRFMIAPVATRFSLPSEDSFFDRPIPAADAEYSPSR